MGEVSNNVECKVPLNVPIFEAIPSEIVIENFTPLVPIEKIFKLRNKDQ